MSFYDEVDSTLIVENHIRQVRALEEREARRILSHYQDVRQELRDRLDRLPGNSFSAQHVRGVLAQVQGAIESITKNLGDDMLSSSTEAATMGVDHLKKEIAKFQRHFLGAVTPINLDAALIATDTSNFLVTKYKTNLDAYGNDLLTQISNGLFQASIGDKSYGDVVRGIGNFFTSEQWKLHRIVRTELHNIYSMGKLNAMSEVQENGSIPNLKKTLMHPMDGRTGEDSIYAAQLGLVADLDQPFEYEWKGKLRSFMSPPDRPNDRSILVPYSPDWGSVDDSSFIPVNQLAKY